ncbi:MAG: murein biosynthesis integral membrane protein MurJ [gamma proteobacterium symbiont of Phacoides pectinatus]
MFKYLAKVGSNTLLSRILGFVRDLVLAHVFGANAGTDAFFVAFKIPNFLRRLFAEGAFSVAFVPVLTEYKEKRGFDELKRFVDRVAGTLGAVLLAVTVVGVLGAPALISVFGAGFLAKGDQSTFWLASDMLRLTFPYLLFISLTAFAGGILNAHNRFGVPAFTPVLLNIALISCALWLAPLMQRPIMALAWGVLLAGILQLLFQYPFLRRLRLAPRFRFAPRDEGVRRIGRLMLPALFGVSVTQLNLLLDTLIASFLASGSISWLYYSDRLMEFPLGVLGVALGTVILPSLSSHHANASQEAFSRTIDWALRWALLFGLPAAVGLFMFSGPMIATLFHSDAFDAQDVLMSRRSLMAYSLGLLPFILIKIFAPGFYARQDTVTPVRFAVIAMLSNMVLNLALVFPLAHAGLALATTLSASLNALLLYRGLRQAGVYQPDPDWRRLLARAVPASALMGLVLYLGAGDLALWLELDGVERAVRLLLWVAAGAGAYFTALLLLGIRPRDFRGV